MASANTESIDPAAARTLLKQASEAASTVVRGQPDAIRKSLAAVIAGGHLLLEDVPGVGKTLLARTLARVLGGGFSRIQFTADMLPSDVLGVQLFNQEKGAFEFKAGPIFSDLVLADEINRATPKTQSAMLEAMADRQVTLDETSYALPAMFTVVATQNPIEHHGAYPLPESQLDRFMVRLCLGYPPRETELELLGAPGAPQQTLDELRPALEPELVTTIQGFVRGVKIAEPAADYLLELVEATRNHPDVALGCSPRGSLAFAQVARAWAFLDGRDFVLPDDFKDLARNVLAHRVVTSEGLVASGVRSQAEAIVDDIVNQTAIPR